MAIKTTTITYDIGLEEIKQMLTRELSLQGNQVDIQHEIATDYHGDQRESWSTHRVTGIKVVVKPKY